MGVINWLFGPGMYDKDSYKRCLTENDVNQLEDEESVRIAINEIYARRGRIFNSDDLNERFFSTDWYKAVRAGKTK